MAANKSRYLRGKTAMNSTTLLKIEGSDGSIKEFSTGKDIEEAILDCNLNKFKQSHHRPFYRFPLKQHFGFKGITMHSNAVLAGVYDTNFEIPTAKAEFLQALQMPQTVAELGQSTMELTLESYTHFWSKAKEITSTYPDALSFSIMKAGAQSRLISQIECSLSRIPLQAGWKNCMEVMFQKKSGITHIGSLCPMVLFSVDCNYASKHIGSINKQIFNI
jgi:hypothetical protein